MLLGTSEGQCRICVLVVNVTEAGITWSSKYVNPFWFVTRKIVLIV